MIGSYKGQTLNCEDINFTKSDMLFLNILYTYKIVKTYKIPKKYYPLVSKASVSRTVQKLKHLGIIEPVGSQNYMTIHKRIVSPEELCIIPFPILHHNGINIEVEKTL